jgi:hypothetical protein
MNCGLTRMQLATEGRSLVPFMLLPHQPWFLVSVFYSISRRFSPLLGLLVDEVEASVVAI